MKQYQTFVFDSYAFDAPSRTIQLHYNFDGIVPFTETIRLPDDMPIDESHPDLDRALFALHLIGGISYYKTCLPPEIEIRSGSLNGEQAKFWNELYEKGLGEFFYRNDIDFRRIINFPFALKNNLTSQLANKPTSSPRLLVPIGGGKDSTVTMELLRKAGYDVTLLRIGRHTLIDEISQEAGLPLWNVNRALAPELFQLNAEGALNGHVPITAYLHFLSVVIGLLSGRTHVAFSDEASADVGNVDFHGMEINHQWSKSIAFEKAFQEYISTFVTKSVTCFSMLRPFSELKITEMFCAYPQYLGLCTSCNRNWQILAKDADRPRWCGQCPKCAFVFAMLAAFLSKDRVLSIFGKNLFADETLLPLYRELLGLEGFKPFECVGTPEETAAAFILARRRDDWDDDAVMKMFIDEALPEITDEEEMIGEAMLSSDDHCIPAPFQSLVADL
jgi:UDP-N-acetyl-alpha-D-muramoyl-L-alanyl-L-glutamate epimerase